MRHAWFLLSMALVGNIFLLVAILLSQVCYGYILYCNYHEVVEGLGSPFYVEYSIIPL